MDRRGDRVRIEGMSALAGQPGIFQRLAVGALAIVEVDWMGRMVSVSVDERDLILDASRRGEGKRKKKSRPSRKQRLEYRLAGN
jgi:hypothetical protein